jgi:GNAT superfamily N-acetyltransferase
VLTRRATPSDAPTIAANIAEGFDSYREWVPSSWLPPLPGPAEIARLEAALEREDVWCRLALEGNEVAGHVALSLITTEDPDPAPPGTVNLWQLFVRRPWQGQGIATELMRQAVAEAGRRGFSTLRLWTPRGAGRARRFYEREGWAHTGRVHEDSPAGIATVEYRCEVR